MSRSRLLGVFQTFPKELFRVNNGRAIQLRVWTPTRRSYDILTRDELVDPKALDPQTYSAPNGASLRPNSPYQQSLVSWRFRGSDTIIYAVPKGTKLPDDLVLVHERSDHYSLQPATIMTIYNLDFKLTQFFAANAKIFSKEQWLKTYPSATDHS
ncbi:hypothetical protein ACQKWADRAFT_307338 [Trichoderma austrokoningii]